MRKSEILPHDAVDLFEKTFSTPYSLAEVREGLTQAAPETEVFFRLATRDDRTDGLYIQFLPVRPIVYSIPEFVAKFPEVASEAKFLVVFRKGRKNHSAPTLFISQLFPIPKKFR